MDEGRRISGKSEIFTGISLTGKSKVYYSIDKRDSMEGNYATYYVSIIAGQTPVMLSGIRRN
jgi:hypothetical protein